MSRIKGRQRFLSHHDVANVTGTDHNLVQSVCWTIIKRHMDRSSAQRPIKHTNLGSRRPANYNEADRRSERDSYSLISRRIQLHSEDNGASVGASYRKERE